MKFQVFRAALVALAALFLAGFVSKILWLNA